jgi:acyl-CoA reductase-like NAD-dependent aldehyde dehydrogenase
MTSTPIDVKDYRHFADNQWRRAKDNQLFEVHEPYSGKLFARVAAGSRADARVAVDAAAKAFPGWSQTAPAERARLFLKAADGMAPTSCPGGPSYRRSPPETR